MDIVRKALRMPCMQIAKNAGVDASVVVAKVEELDSEVGYDAMNNEYVNMMEKGIIDPTKVWEFLTCILCISSISVGHTSCADDLC